jgi:tetratricopeptide (TPR) repeat protein
MRPPSSGSAPLPPLDDELGPAVSRAPDALQAMRDRILTRAGRGSGVYVRPGRTSWWLAIAVGLGLISAGSVLAAVRSWPELRAFLGSSERPADRASAPKPTYQRAQLPAPVLPPVVIAPEPPAAEPKAVTAAAPAVVAHRASAPHGTADLLAHANQLRAEQRWAAAETLYLRVLGEAGSADARSTAALAAAELRLSQLHDPRAALALFERTLALAPASVLAEQAQHGIAQSYRALGDSAKERAALQAFLSEHPHSAMRARATARLRALSGTVTNAPALRGGAAQ